MSDENNSVTPIDDYMGLFSSARECPGRNLYLAGYLVAVVTLVMVGFTVFVGPASGAAEPRDGVGNASAPVIVFQGETLDVREVRQSGSGNPIGSGSVEFEGVSGDADGDFRRASDASRVDFDDFPTGGYDTNDDGQRDVFVRTPVIREVTVRTTSGADVTNGRIPADTTVNISVRFNFDVADRVEVSIIDPDGLDVTGEVIGSGSATHITTDGGTVQANFEGESEGAYRIEVEASELEAEQGTNAVVRSSKPTVALDRKTVQKGESAIATILGTPGERVHLRVRSSDLDGVSATDSGAREVFDGVGDVIDRVGDSNEGVVAAIVRLDDNGEGRVRIQSRALRAESTTRIELAEGTNLRRSATSRVALRVERRLVSAPGYPAMFAVGQEFTLRGQARGASTVKAYARIDRTWEPLFSDGDRNEYAEADVSRDGRFTLTIDSSRVINFRGNYRIGIAADATDRYRSDQELTPTEFGRLTTTTIQVRAATGRLSASLSRETLAADTGDEVTLSINADGDRVPVHVYLVTHRGALQVGERIVTRDGTFNRRFSDFPGRGEYRFVVVSQGDDGVFESTPQNVQARLNGRESQEQTLAKIRDQYSQAGSDDNIRELRLRVQTPTLSLTSLPQDGAIEPGRIRFEGTTNRQPGTEVLVDVRRGDDRVTSGETSVDSAGNWSVQLDLSNEPSGRYTVVIDAEGTVYTRQFDIPGATPTPTAEPTPTVTPTVTATPVPTAAAETSPTPTAAASPTPTLTSGGSGPGFGLLGGVGSVLGAILVLLARRRK